MTKATQHIRLMDAIDGAWDHAVVVTYSADLQFFERAVLPRISGPRNTVVLVDQTMLAGAAEALTHGGGSVGQVNATYLAAPVTARGAAHAKLALLAAKDRARLLVGSGNLTYSGYNADTEVFARFEADRRDPSPGQAFLAVRELLDGLVDDGRVDDRAAAHLARLWQSLTWLGSDEHPTTTVVHNRSRPILDAFVEACDSPVQRLTVCSPFWDPGCRALAEAVDRLRPDRVDVLVQDGLTHLDLVRLADVLDARGVAWQLLPVGITDRLVHAKLFVVHHGDTATLLAGSPNASTPALLRTTSTGNIELATISRVPAGHPDAMLSHLEPGGPRDAATLALLPPAPEATDEQLAAATVSVRQATWSRGTLELRVGREGIDLEVSIGAHDPVTAGVDDGRAVLVPDLLLADRLDAGSWVRVREAGTEVWSAPTFPYRVEALARQMEVAPGRRQALRRIALGTPDVDDDVAALLGELEHTMLATTRALKDLATTAAPATSDTVDDANLFSSLDQVWVALEQTPQLAQYRTVDGVGGDTGVPSDLAVILAALGMHLPGAPPVRDEPEADGAPRLRDDEGVEDANDLDEEERAELRQQRIDEEQARTERTRRHYARFYKRVATAYGQPEFLQRLGPVTVATQLVVHLALLARLLPQRQAKPVDALGWVVSLLDATLPSDDSTTVLRPNGDRLSDEASKALAERAWWPAVIRFLIAVDAATERATDRDAQRTAASLSHRLLGQPVPINGDPFATVAEDDTDAAAALWSRLHDLARAGITPASLLRYLERVAGVAAWSAFFERVGIIRPSVGREQVTVDQLRLPTTEDPPEDALRVVAAWASLAPGQEYFRLVIGEGQDVLLTVRDLRDDSGWVYDGEDDVDVDAWPVVRPVWLDWLEDTRPTEP